MNSEETKFNERGLTILINGLLEEKDRYKQELIAERIKRMKDERTASLVADLLYSDDAYIRNIAIELLVTMKSDALQAISDKLADENRNIRKFALDALKHIKGERSCEIAVAALDDPDENVVEAALEVIGEQGCKEAAGKLLNMLETSESVWIMNALLIAFERLGMKEASEVIPNKIHLINASAFEKNILMNTYVRALGKIGSYDDLDRILNQYVIECRIDNSNLVHGLCGLIVSNQICSLSEKIFAQLEKILKESWDYKDINLLMLSLTALTQLQMDFFLQDIQEIFHSHKDEEFFAENLYRQLLKLDRIPEHFIADMLSGEEPELVTVGLKLIRDKNISGFDNIVKNLSMHVAEGDAELILDEQNGGSQLQDTELLLLKLEHQNLGIRKAAAKKMIESPEPVKFELLEQIVLRNPEAEGSEALEVLYRLNPDIGWKHISYRMDSLNDETRSRLINIIEYSSDDDFYRFMNTMINDPEQKVRKKAIKAIGRRTDHRSLQLLKQLYENESEAVNKMEIISNIYKFNDDSALKMLMDAASGSEILTRIAAARSLGFCNRAFAEPVLENMTGDPILEVREAAKEALSRTEVAE